ncbi:MAG: methyl-accepting chemotaxis protein [Gorillibacterium sp.]|nr:methyl-accepting chemotaxis protein [Gorillibacterium sp.]
MKWFYNLKTSVKLISTFLIVSVIMTFVGVYSLNNLGKLNDALDNMYANNLIPVQSVLQSQASYTRMRILPRNLYLGDGDDAQIQKQITTYEEEKKKVDEAMADFKKTVLSEQSQQALAPFAAEWSQTHVLFDKAVQLSQAGQNEALKKLINEDMQVSADKLRPLLDDLISINVKEAGEAKLAGKALYTSSRNIIIVVLISAVIFSILLGFFISQIISKPLRRVSILASQVADGDLRNTVDINTKDEVGLLATAMNTMVGNLNRTVSTILVHSQSLSSAAQEISASTEEIASSNTSQAGDAQTIGELLKELSLAIHTVAQNTDQAASLSNDTVRIAVEGNEVIQASMKSMRAVSTQMSKLEEDSLKIGDILDVIEDIADQTNLLALNAAIEAARAGEQGRGFAVVADEVRKLAERSGEATKQITGIIKGMQSNTRESVKAVQESAEFSEKSGASFQQIVSKVNEAGHKVSEIAAASEEQASQSSNVLAAVENISATTEEAAAGSEETAATAQSLAQLAEELQQSVAAFRLH